MVDPLEHSVRIWALRDGSYDEVDDSALLGLTAAGVAADVDWP